MLLDAGAATPPASVELGGGAESSGEQETAGTGKDDPGAGPPKKSRGRKRRVPEKAEPQPERKRPGRKKKVAKVENPPVTPAAEETPGSSRDAAATAPEERETSSGTEELQGPVTARSPVTTVTNAAAGCTLCQQLRLSVPAGPS